MSGAHERSETAATPSAAPDGRPRQAVHGRQTARRLPLPGPGRRRRAQADPGHPRPNRRGEREEGPARDAAHLRGLAARRESEPQPSAGGSPGERVRPSGRLVAGREVGLAVPPPPRATGAATPAARDTSLDQLCINTVRTLAMDAVQQAESGHPGTPMAVAPLAYVLWQRPLRYNPANPDRFRR